MLKDLALTGNTVGLLFLLVILLTLGIIFYVKRVYFKKDPAELKDRYNDLSTKEHLQSRTKYHEYDAFSFRSSLLGYGLAAALATTLFSFAWTQYEKTVDYSDYDFEVEDLIEQEPPRTAEPPPPPPPPPPPVIEEVPDEEIEEDPPPLQDMSVTEETVIDEPKPVVDDAPPPPPPPPPPPVKGGMFKGVEQMPRFPGCENMAGTEKEKEDCAKGKMLAFVFDNLKYPAIAKENGIQGNVIVQFTVGKKGEIEDAKVVRGIGAGCDEAALKAVNAMNSMGEKWIPGKQRGRPVKVLYTLPVRFKLEG